METALAAHQASAQLSPLALFMAADWVVKAIMLGLIVASLACWAVIFNRAAAFRRAGREIAAAEQALAEGLAAEDIAARHPGFAAAVAACAANEWQASVETGARQAEGLRARLATGLDLSVAERGAWLDRHLGLLATVGNSAPFVGLFGTVWGIMNAFTAIAAAEDTSLAVVAPGIAEALFATALGLLAAIPASIAYNRLSADAGRLVARLEGLAGRFAMQMSRRADAEAGRWA